MGGCSDKDSTSTSSKNQKPKNPVLVVVGPSGVGKDTVMQKLFEKHPNSFKKGTTHTTRQKRPGEIEGVNYYYVSKEEFLKLKDNGGLVEDNFYNNNYYGLSKKELEKAGSLDKIMYVIIDINGAAAVHNLNIPATFVAIIPENEDVLEERLKGRGTESEEVIQGRLNTAMEELRRINEEPFFNHRIVNKDLDNCVLELEAKLKEVYGDFK